MRNLDCQLVMPMLMLKTSLEWKIDHPEDGELEVMLHSADSREQCLDRHHRQHKTQEKRQYLLLK